ncbi:MAG: hypothetical protein QM820_19670 [Minicystis sp.]
MFKALSLRAGTLALSLALASAACSNDTGGGDGGAGGSGGSSSSSSTSSSSSSSSTGGTGCMEITIDDLVKVTDNGDYNYGSKTSAIGGGADDHYVLELYDGLDTPDITIETDAKNNFPSTCEACGWVFQDGGDEGAAKIYYHASGHITLTVPSFGDELSVEPTSGTLTDIVFREVELANPSDRYSATIKPGGACLHLASGSF